MEQSSVTIEYFCSKFVIISHLVFCNFTIALESSIIIAILFFVLNVCANCLMYGFHRLMYCSVCKVYYA